MNHGYKPIKHQPCSVRPLAGTRLLGVSLAAVLLLVGSSASAKLHLAASIADLASIAASVGGDQVECFAIARSSADVHHVEVLPSYMVRVARSDVYLKVGLGLDQWADQIIDGSRNDRLVIVDCSLGIDALEKPTGTVTAAQGDVHPNGNPHYWLDPRNGAIVAREVAETLGRIDPAHAADFEARAEVFSKEVEAEMAQGLKALSTLPNRDILTYHASWPYLAHAFKLEIAGTAEPVPGIPPTGKHLADLVDLVKQRRIAILLQEPYFSDDAGEFLSREAGLRVVKISPSCDTPEAGSYLGHIGQILRLIAGQTSAPGRG